MPEQCKCSVCALVLVLTLVAPHRQVRNNQVPKPRAMVEDILARVTLLDAELGAHAGPVPPPSPTSSMGSPHANGSGSQVRMLQAMAWLRCLLAVRTGIMSCYHASWQGTPVPCQWSVCFRWHADACINAGWRTGRSSGQARLACSGDFRSDAWSSSAAA